jgi:hypothetical protein
VIPVSGMPATATAMSATPGMPANATNAHANTRDSAAPVASASAATDSDSDSAVAASAASTQPLTRGAEEDDNDSDDDGSADTISGASAAKYARRDRARIDDDGSHVSPSPLLAASQRAVCELVAGAEFRLTLGYLYAAPAKQKHTHAHRSHSNIAISLSFILVLHHHRISALRFASFNRHLAYWCIFPHHSTASAIMRLSTCCFALIVFNLSLLSLFFAHSLVPFHTQSHSTLTRRATQDFAPPPMRLSIVRIRTHFVLVIFVLVLIRVIDLATTVVAIIAARAAM